MIGLLAFACIGALGWMIADHLRRTRRAAERSTVERQARERRASGPTSHPFQATEAWKIDAKGRRHPL